MFKNILLAVDGSNYSDTVIAHGIELAKAFKSHISVLTVSDIRIFEWASAIGADGFVPVIPTGIYKEESSRLLDEKSDKILAKTAHLLEKENLAFETSKVVGAPVDAILEHSLTADLVIMGKRGEYERWDNKALGATVESVGRSIRKPLIVSKRTFQPIRRVLIAYDGSDHANRALQYAGHIAEALCAQIHILVVTDDRELGEHFAKEAENYLINYQVTLQTTIQEGSPDKVICEIAANEKVDLIAIGAYGRSRIKETILGSTTEHILRLSTCPVLLAR
ncbi:MAG TPA: universal stress protein [bacterium]|nr:universal stress protein [bacterium]HPG44669.1 universal stress protein [bacterium]HPM99424.1 universal stress protein [bacterium]